MYPATPPPPPQTLPRSGAAASRPLSPRYFIPAPGGGPPAPANWLVPAPPPSEAVQQLRDGVCRVTDTCGDPDTGATGCYFVFRGYPCVVTSLLQVRPQTDKLTGAG